MNTLGYKLASGPNTLTNTSTSLLLQQEQLHKDWIKDFMLHVWFSEETDFLYLALLKISSPAKKFQAIKIKN